MRWLFCFMNRNMGRSNSSTRGPGSNAGSRESSRTRDMSRESREKQAPASVELTYDEFEKKTKAIMDEFLQIQDSKVKFLKTIFIQYFSRFLNNKM